MPMFDSETVERLRTRSPKEAYQEVKIAIYRTGESSSEAFLDAFEELVEAGILSWDQIEHYEAE